MLTKKKKVRFDGYKYSFAFSWLHFPQRCSLMSPSFSPPCQEITYIARSHRHRVTRTVQRVYHPAVGAGVRDVWASVPLPIPPMPASHLRHCNLIVIDYALMVCL